CAGIGRRPANSIAEAILRDRGVPGASSPCPAAGGVARWGRDRREARAAGGAALPDLRPARRGAPPSDAAILLTPVSADRSGRVAGRELPGPGRPAVAPRSHCPGRDVGRRMIDSLFHDPVGAIQLLLLMVPGLLLAVTVHEVAHGWVADRLGDPTARLAG